MADDKLSKLLETQISLTEWLAKINHADAKPLREEDNVKRQRLGHINEITGLPYDKPTSFNAEDIAKRTPAFKEFLKEHGDELCALRLIPKKGVHAEKLRNRGKSIRNVMGWFDSLAINALDYTADFMPHVDEPSWATIFVINGKGIFGEIYKGGHHVLTQGLYEGKSPIVFAYDFGSDRWRSSPENEDAVRYLKEMTSLLKVSYKSKQLALSKTVGAEFSHGYIKGYFETTHSNAQGTWFIDYNRLLGDLYENYILQQPSKTEEGQIKGRTACEGEVSGRVKIVNDPLKGEIEGGDILVCEMTTPDYIPLMIKASGIITDKGGILCHAAIVARELNKPCIVGAENATAVLETGDEVVMNATEGWVSLSRK
jgi:phosphohistidine swiveling domain-containing protein